MPTLTAAPGLHTWTIEHEDGTIRYAVGSSLQTVIGSGPVVRAERGTPAIDDTPPTLSALTPDTAAIGVPSFTLRVQGSGFKPEHVIVFNGYTEPTTFVSESEVTTGVNMDVWQGASLPLPVVVRTLTGQDSNALTFTFTAAPEA